MVAIGINHVSIGTDRFEETVRFYETVFGLERLPTHNFGFRTQFLRCGDLQIHVFEHDQMALRLQHFGLDVDDFMQTYRTARQLGVLDVETLGRSVTELPDGSLQMYLRDPAGNLIEVNWPDADTIERNEIEELKLLSDLFGQEDTAADASLYLDRPQLQSRRRTV